jgi:Rieske Fe-S protein
VRDGRVRDVDIRRGGTDSIMAQDLNRRHVLLGAGAVGASAALSACGESSTTAATSATSSPAQADSPLVLKVSDVPVAGGHVDEAAKVIVTQPEAGQFHAFSSVCTHKGCQVEGVSDGKIRCPCHGSEFSPTDGSVVGGPATQPLASKTVTATGDQLTVS